MTQQHERAPIDGLRSSTGLRGRDRTYQWTDECNLVGITGRSPPLSPSPAGVGTRSPWSRYRWDRSPRISP